MEIYGIYWFYILLNSNGILYGTFYFKKDWIICEFTKFTKIQDYRFKTWRVPMVIVTVSRYCGTVHGLLSTEYLLNKILFVYVLQQVVFANFTNNNDEIVTSIYFFFWLNWVAFCKKKWWLFFISYSFIITFWEQFTESNYWVIWRCSDCIIYWISVCHRIDRVVLIMFLWMFL